MTSEGKLLRRRGRERQTRRQGKRNETVSTEKKFFSQIHSRGDTSVSNMGIMN